MLKGEVNRLVEIYIGFESVIVFFVFGNDEVFFLKEFFMNV